MEVDHITSFVNFTPQGGELVMDVEVCQCDACPDPTGDRFCQTCTNPSCLTARNAVFHAAPLPQIVVPDATTFAITMTEHDPILCTDTTGNLRHRDAPAFWIRLPLPSAFNMTTGMPAGTFAGTFIISTH
jgi:hypothetical protein